MEKINFELNRAQLLELKHKNNDAYQLIMSLKKDEADYCETLDKEKLKKECELGYFSVEDLFTKEQIGYAHLDIVASICKNSFSHQELSRINDINSDANGLTKQKPYGLKNINFEINANIRDEGATHSEKLPVISAEIGVASDLPNVFLESDLDFDVAYKHSKLVRAINEKKQIKIRVTPEQSEIVQKICFALGVKWGCGSAVVEDTDYKFLYIKNFKNKLELSRGNGEGFFKTVRCKEYSFEKGAFV